MILQAEPSHVHPGAAAHFAWELSGAHKVEGSVVGVVGVVGVVVDVAVTQAVPLHVHPETRLHAAWVD